MEYLKGNSAEYDAGGVLCVTCYKIQVSILTNIESQCNNENLSDDIMLWEQSLEQTDNKFTIAILQTVIIVVRELLQDKALLLTAACSYFLEAYTGEANTCTVTAAQVMIETGDSTSTQGGYSIS